MDNLEQIRQRVISDIDPNGLPESILAQNHNEILQSFIRSSGKYGGIPLIAKNTPSGTGAHLPGELYWNGNAMNNTSDFSITTAKLDSDGNDIGILFEKMNVDDYIKFKDLPGRSVYLKFKSISQGVVAGTDIYTIVVTGIAENTNYVYQASEEQVCVLSLQATGAFSVSTDVITRYKNRQIPNTNNNAWEPGDFGIGFTLDGTFLNPGVYVSGDPNIISSWDPNQGTVIEPETE